MSDCSSTNRERELGLVFHNLARVVLRFKSFVLAKTLSLLLHSGFEMVQKEWQVSETVYCKAIKDRESPKALRPKVVRRLTAGDRENRSVSVQSYKSLTPRAEV